MLDSLSRLFQRHHPRWKAEGLASEFNAARPDSIRPSNTEANRLDMRVNPRIKVQGRV